MKSIKQSPNSSRRLSKVRQRDTKAELEIRRILHKAGMRYRVQRVVSTRPYRTADIVFPKQKLAIFVDGCFWHGCPAHASWPKTNSEFWKSKIEANVLRDHDTTSRLSNAGWTVLRFWEHVPPHEAATSIIHLVQKMKSEANAS